MILSNPYPTTLDSITYPVTPIMQRWFEKKTQLRIVQDLKMHYLVGDGKVTQIVRKDMVEV